jgi:predicted RNA-binding Zn ribbon-like protein
MRTTVITHAFAPHDLVGGDPALDFINTVAGRDQAAHAPARDWIDGYARLLDWAQLAGLLPARTIGALRVRASTHPARASTALRRAKELRESLFALTGSMIKGQAPPRAALGLLREHWLVAVNAHELRSTRGRVRATLRNNAAELDLVAAMVAWRVVENVLDAPPDRLRMCQGTDCAWVFIDTSKAGRRCWCDMKVCGNLAKARRFTSKARKRDSKSH